jgi:hypothetical protein
MATYRSVHGLMLAVENLLKRRLPDELGGGAINGKVQLLSSTDLKTIKAFGSTVGLYLYRVLVDSTGRNRWLAPTPGSSGIPRRELPLNLHFLLISWGASPQAELELHAWAMSELAATPEFDVGALIGSDGGWREGDRAQMLPEELPNEELFKIWDAMPCKYTLSSAYVLKTARIELPGEAAGRRVVTRSFAGEPQS